MSREPFVFDVVGIGENSVDLVYRVARLPQPGTAGSKLPISGHSVRCGGQVATTMAACAALGLRTRYVGAIGNDANGTLIRRALEERGVDVSGAAIRTAANRYAVIMVDDGGDRVVLWERDAALDLTAAEVTSAIGRPRWIHVDATDVPAAMAAARLGAERGIPVSCDVDAATGQTLDLVRSVNVAVLAEGLPEAFTGQADLEAALRQLWMTRHTAICVTLGARGAAMLHGGAFARAPALKVTPVDTTGAGDVFRGALIYAMLRGDSPAEMLRFSNAAAAVSVTRSGALEGVPSLDEIERLMAHGS